MDIGATHSSAFKDRYEISDSDGVFRMPRADLARLMSEIIMLDLIQHVEIRAGGPLTISRVSPKDSGQEDLVASILGRYGIDISLQHNQFRHYQCHPRLGMSEQQ